MQRHNQLHTARGFTLIEVMAVLVIMGLIVAMVSLNFSGDSDRERLEKEAVRFMQVFNLAAEFSLMNNVELGVEIVKDNSYRFLLLSDDDNWLVIEQEKVFKSYELPESFKLSLELEDLPWQESSTLFAEDAFETEEFTLDEEEEQPPFPQVFILSSGDITPFVLSFEFEPEFGNAQPETVRVLGEYSTPLKLEQTDA